MSYEEALNRKRACDIFVDQIGDLGYGINSLEAMAMGIPACSCLAPGFAEMYPDHAFIDINAENLAEQLIPLVKDAHLRLSVGERGRQWVRDNHDAEKVVKKIHRIAGV
jgi:glycosyltransferase involved in cell wall biosynthesis